VNQQRGKNFVGMSSWVTTINLAAYFANLTAILAGGLFIGALAQAQPAQSQQIFENVRLGPKFSPDPVTIRGISGGAVPARNVAGHAETPTGPCMGFVDQAPDHTVVLTTFFNYLSLQVNSPEDTTLLISGPGGSWCNDDYQGKNPGVAGQWLAGTYRVWVGSYDTNNYHPYIIRITEAQLLNPGPYRR
jgi:hypothetical protein